MKIAPVSADLLIKLAVGVAVLGVAWFAVNKVVGGVGMAIEGITSLPSRAWEGIKSGAVEGGGAWLDQYAENPVVTPGASYGGKYKGPMVNDQGYDFGNLSG